jgi:hypothetical protein
MGIVQHAVMRPHHVYIHHVQLQACSLPERPCSLARHDWHKSSGDELFLPLCTIGIHLLLQSGNNLPTQTSQYL